MRKKRSRFKSLLLQRFSRPTRKLKNWKSVQQSLRPESRNVSPRGRPLFRIPPRKKTKRSQSKPSAVQNISVPQTPTPIASWAPQPLIPISHPGSLDTYPLSIASIIEPNDRLQSSIEGFLLDQRSEHTRTAYGKDLKRFVKFLVVKKYTQGEMTLIDRRLIVGYKDYLLQEKLSHTTIDRHLATLKSFFRWLVEDEVIAKNPAENVRFLNPKRESITQGLSDEEVIRILNQPNLHTKSGSLHYAILMILFFCGLRRSEVCSLTQGSFSEERGQPYLRLKGKGNKERIVILIPQVIHSLEYYYRMIGKDLYQLNDGDAPLLKPVKNNRTRNKDKFLDPSLIFYIVRKYARKAGITRRVSPHSARATAISNARDHQVPDRAIQEFAGWSSPMMITRYDKRKTTLAQSAAHAIDYGAVPLNPRKS